MKFINQLASIKIILLCILFLSNGIQAQKFGDIDMARLKETAHPIDPDASHAFIFKNCTIHYDFDSRLPRIVSEYHYRVKIYKDEGIDQADIVRYLNRNRRDVETITGIKAESYNLVNGKMDKSKLSKKEVYKEKVSEIMDKVSFAIPNARVGSIIEYKFKVNSPFLYAFPRHYFQMNVPVDYSRLKVDVPEYFTMAPSATGLVPLNQKKEKKTSYGASVAQFTFDASDIPAVQDDKYVLDIKDYRASLKYELSQVAIPGREPMNFTKDWNSICKNLMEINSFGDAMKSKVKEASEMLATISSLSESEKLVNILEFIHSNIAWNGGVGIYGTTNYKKLFQAGTGSVAVMNLLLINLCRKANLTADPVLTKYRFNGLLNSGFPSLTELDYAFALVEVDGNQLLVDASSPCFVPGSLPLRAMNVEALLVKEKSGQLFPMTNTNLNYLRQAGKYSFNLEERRLEGNGKTVIKGYAAVKARQKNQEEDDEDEQDLVKSSVDNDNDDEDEDDEELEDDYTYTETKGLENKYGDITSSYDAILYSPFEAIGNEIYIDAFVTLEFEENPFLNEIRNYPAFFNSKHHFNHVSILDIPEGYVLKSVPEKLVMKIINDKGLFSYTINESPGKLTINAMFKIEHDIFLPEEYASLYAFFDKVLQKQREKIVFVRE